jgi:hypothetical protein
MGAPRGILQVEALFGTSAKAQFRQRTCCFADPDDQLKIEVDRQLSEALLILNHSIFGISCLLTEARP